MSRLQSLILSLCVALSMAAASIVPDRSAVLPGVDEQSMLARLSHSDLQPLEGTWKYPAEDMTVGIERYKGEHGIEYRIVMLASRDIDLLPGTVVGYIAPSAAERKYSLWIYSERNDSVLKHPVECVATLNAQATSLTFDKAHWKLKVHVNIMRFLPTLFRGISVIPEKKGESLPVGFNKVFPEDSDSQSTRKIIYL